VKVGKVGLSKSKGNTGRNQNYFILKQI